MYKYVDYNEDRPEVIDGEICLTMVKTEKKLEVELVKLALNAIIRTEYMEFPTDLKQATWNMRMLMTGLFGFYVTVSDFVLIDDKITFSITVEGFEGDDKADIVLDYEIQNTLTPMNA